MPSSEGLTLADQECAVALLAINSIERPAMLCNKASTLGDQTGTSPHLGALSRLEWLRTESLQLVSSARCRWSTVQMQLREIGTLVVYLRKMQ